MCSAAGARILEIASAAVPDRHAAASPAAGQREHQPMTPEPVLPVPSLVIADSVLTACATWGAARRRRGNDRVARAQFWAMTSPPGPTPPPAVGTGGYALKPARLRRGTVAGRRTSRSITTPRVRASTLHHVVIRVSRGAA
jgi:hypothetical protein